MRVAVVTRSREALSLVLYREHLARDLGGLGVECLPVPLDASAPRGVDLLWDPGLGMRAVPPVVLGSELPVVVTVHGLLEFALPWRDTAHGVGNVVRRVVSRSRVARSWRAVRNSVRRVITVSEYGAEEVRRALSLPAEVLRPILHGVDHDTFQPDGRRAEHGGAYFLMVAQHQAKKNVDRVFQAWSSLPAGERPELIAVVPGYPESWPGPGGADVRRRPHPPEELAPLYRGALALVAPSLHETFGMPLVEAMACGCPVITSNVTACPEVTGDAALHVDPRSVDDICDAMAAVAGDSERRATMRERGLARAAALTWRASAATHAAVFEEAVGVAAIEVSA